MGYCFLAEFVGQVLHGIRFVFIFTSTGNVVPYVGNSLEGNSDIELTNKSQYCNKTSVRAQYACAYFAMLDESPEDTSKKYWGDFIK